MSTLSLQNINKVYPNKVQAVFDFNLDIKDKEFIVFVGPSGCGKSTTLRMVAGLEDISAGELYIDGEYMNNTAPKDRNIAMVFQSYALYPHMTVYKNMAFALELRKTMMPILIHSDEAEAIMKENKDLMKEVKKINRAFKKKQDATDLLPGRAELYKKIFANQAKIEEISKPVIGKDEYGIKVLNKSLKKLNNDLAKLNKTLEREEKAIGEDRDEEYIRIINAAIGEKTKQIEKETKALDYLEHYEVALKKPRHLTRYEIDLEVNKAAESIDLIRYLFRKPGALSGGQRQRVALGRAIVRKPKVFLMDEPLSNLDAKLRVQTRGEILKIHEAVGATTIYVTHDQTEAMTMADRIVVMKDGYVQQIGTPDELYSDPDNQFVAGFIGSPAMNFIGGVVSKDKIMFQKELTKEEIAEGKVAPKPYKFALSKEQAELLKEYNGKKVLLGVRPEHIRVKADKKKSSAPIKLDVDYSEILGNESFIYSDIAGYRICFKTFDKLRFKRGEKVDVYFDMPSVLFFDIEDGKRIRAVESDPAPKAKPKTKKK